MTPIQSSRRRWLGGTLGSLSLLAMSRRVLASPRTEASPAKRCLLLWMNGGPSQLETFDPKPGTATGGPTKSVRTKVPGLELSEHLPMLAERADQLAVIRNVNSSEGAHERAQYFLHTGFQLVPAFPRPALGSVVSHQLPPSDSPKYVLLGGSGFGPAYCGPDHASFAISDANAARTLLGQVANRKDDIELLRKLGAGFDRRNGVSEVVRRQSMISRVERIVETPFRDALDVSSESQTDKQRYGEDLFGQRCLLARRLLEREVPFVEVQLDGWDTHANNFTQVPRLAASLDRGWSALTDDLRQSGLWDDTLIVWMGDFGRTPTINANNGRDHFPAVTPVVFSGGAVQGGSVIGQTNRGGTAIEGDSYRVADVAATMLHLLGIAPDQEFQTSFDSPTKATDSGKIIRPLLS